ncbi:eukaryotic translation initiation factor 3 subunit A [Dimargaris verticillata]|uniref:Eukaryotic translation initiation factor 3 subunit A n=1 Tax=Dimargaris verticillata TaxID=2761393 RepID=A0A9W8EBW1_9FUNG|nr:eukaryotic translation initiation factor 3 subunit A [Dimargaris verticillata]
MRRLVAECVKKRDGQMLKDVLQSYRNICQNTHPESLDRVIAELIELAEAGVKDAQSKADKLNVEKIDDLEATESPESILLSVVSEDQDKDRTDRGVVTPWLKFLWETYRNLLDTLRNNTRLETSYHEVAQKALKFCKDYERRNEFRRLCEKLRTHLSAIVKSTNQVHGVNLQDADSLQRHLELRFDQLEVATTLELWQEAYRSTEDIHVLIANSKRAPNPAMLVDYYEKLTRIMTVSGNRLFHAAAWHRYYEVVCNFTPKMDPELHKTLASHVVLSTMAVPIINPMLRIATMQEDENKVRESRYCNLLGLTHSPRRSTLIAAVVNSDILTRVAPELRSLFHQLEDQFHPLSICHSVAPTLLSLLEKPEFSNYVKSLQVCVVTRLLQQLSQVYTSLKLDYLLSLACFPEPLAFSANEVEQFVMNGCRSGEFPIRLDYKTRSVHFTTDVFSETSHASKGRQLQPTPSEQIRSQLANLATSLLTVTRAIDPEVTRHQLESRAQAVATALSQMKEEHEWVMQRKALIERRKEITETLRARKEKEAAREKALRLQRELEASRRRQAEEAERRERERLEKERETIRLIEARKMAESLKATSGLELNEKELVDLDSEKLTELRVAHLDKVQRTKEARFKSVAKRLDHIERAIRLEEAPLKDQDYEKQNERDLETYQQTRDTKLTASRHAFDEGMKLKSKMQRMLPSYLDVKRTLESRRSDELTKKKKQIEQKIATEKKYRVEEFHRLREQEKARKVAEEAERKRREEEERIRAEEEARLAEERRVREAAEREAELERRRKLDEIAETQRRREEEVAARQEARRLERLAQQQEATTANRYVPGAFSRKAPTPVAPVSSSSAAAEPLSALRRSENAWRPGAARSAGPTTGDESTISPPAATAAAGAASRPRTNPFGNARPAGAEQDPAAAAKPATPLASASTGARYVPPSQRNRQA